MSETTRRQVLGAGIGAASVTMTAASYRRVLGANDRIAIGMIGCGARAQGLRRMAHGSARTMNVEMTAVCDLWTVNREKAAADVTKKFGRAPRAFKYSEELLAAPDIDAVMIATADHQHANLMIDVVAAGKDCYCEKPMANRLDEAKQARDAVQASGQICQMGSQWVSDPYHRRVRDIVRSGQLGKITRIEQRWNTFEQRWRDPKDPDIRVIREADTDWKRWLAGRPFRPFDPRVYFEFRLYRDFSAGLADQWMTHGSTLVHLYMDEGVPESMVASGGILMWNDGRENPDTFTAVATYKKGFVHVFQAQFGNGFGNQSAIMGANGTLWSPGAEGSQRWTLTPEGGRSGSPISRAQPVTVAGAPPPQLEPSDDSKPHFDDWVLAMRSRRPPNGDIHGGFAHSVAVIMAARAYREGRRMYWDPGREEILDHPPG
jgi:predicted dehydrogenase